MLIKVYGTEARALLDSGAVQNVFVCRNIGNPTAKIKRPINVVTGEKSPLVGMLKDVPVHLEKKIVNLSFLVVEGSPYDVFVRDPTMENMKGVLDLRKLVASFVINGNQVEIPMQPDHVQEDPVCK